MAIEMGVDGPAGSREAAYWRVIEAHFLVGSGDDPGVLRYTMDAYASAEAAKANPSLSLDRVEGSVTCSKALSDALVAAAYADVMRRIEAAASAPAADATVADVLRHGRGTLRTGTPIHVEGPVRKV